MEHDNAVYGVIRTTKELGRIARQHRKNRHLTLGVVAGLGNVSARFLSEFERGKETAEIGKILKALRTLGLEVTVHPRGSRPTPTPPVSLLPGSGES